MADPNGATVHKRPSTLSRLSAFFLEMRIVFWEKWIEVSQRKRYALQIGLSLAISIAGVVWATVTHRCAEAGRGGAIATILAVATLFLRPDFGRITYDNGETVRAEIKDSNKKLSTEIEDVVQWLRINSNGQEQLNLAVFIASLIGSLFWGFGDLLPKYFGTCPVCHC